MRADPFFVQNTMNSLNQAQSIQQQLIEELATGVSVNSLSSNPTAAGQDAMVTSEISVDDTFSQNEATTLSMMQVTDSTLSDVVSQLQSAISAATAGDNGTLNSTNEQAVANTLEGIQSTILGLANQSFQGVSIFAGTQGGKTAFTLDSSTSPATVTYNGDENTMIISTPTGASIPTSIPGDQVFGGGASGSTGANVLGVLSNLINDFSTGTSAVADTAALGAAVSQVGSIQAKFASGMQQLSSTATYIAGQVTELASTQNTLVAANFAQVSTQLASNETQQTALLDVMATVDKSNDLFDFLN
jgi:flagellar hook-associated protein 3 FlgL